MKRVVWALVVVAVLLLAGKVDAWGDNYKPGRLIVTSGISNSSVASSWAYVNGSVIPWQNYKGDRISVQAYQITVYSVSTTNALEVTPVDFCFSYGNSPTAGAWFPWKASWGPYQTVENLPPEGIWISPTPTAGTYSAALGTKH